MKRFFPRLILVLFFYAFTPCAAQAIPKAKNNVAAKKKVIAFSGAKYILASQKNIPISYMRSYSKVGKHVFKTTYNIYNQQQKLITVVTALHNKKTHNIEVSVKDLEIKGFPIVNMERTGYDVPYMGRFGSIGKVGAVGKGRSRTTAPGQLTVKFVSRRFDYLKVVHIADAHEDSGKELQVYILDERSQ